MLIKANSFNSKAAAKSNCNLSSTTAQKMILRLLKDAKMPKSKLIECLEVTVPELVKLTENRASLELMKRISLPLVNRYCLTEFIDDMRIK